MKKITSILFSFILITLSLFLSQCNSGSEQSSGVLNQLDYSSPACVVQERTYRVVNNNLTEAQSVSSITLTEITAPTSVRTNYFKISKVVTGDHTYLGPTFSDILIAPGGTLAITVRYTPRPIATDPILNPSLRQIVTNVRGAIDLQMRGVILGSRQISLTGFANSTDTSNCGSIKKLTISKITYKLLSRHTSSPVETSQEFTAGAADVPVLEFVNSAGDLSINNSETFQISVPTGSSTQIAKIESTPGGTYNDTDGNLTFDSITFLVASVIHLDVKMTTGMVTQTNSDGDGSLSLTGQAFQAGTNHIKLVFIAKPNDAALTSFGATAAPLIGSLIGVEIEGTLTDS